MHNQMQKAEDYAKDLAKYYIAASRHLQSEQNAILRRFALTHHMTIKEAEELISSLKDPSSIKELIKALKKDPKNAELVREFEAQAARSRIMRLNALQSQVTYTAGQIQVLLNKKAQKLFVNLARSAYYNTMFDAMQRAGYGFNVKMLDPKRIKRVMDRSWTGAGFSKRLWSNTKALEDAVKREIMVNLLTGRPLIKASQAINEEFGKGYNNARRLIRTESAYITNQMTLEGYKDLEADKYIYVAILDLKTSEICRGLDKKRFLVKSAKVGVNYPPMHPWCRSTTIPWMPDSLLKNMKQRALDPKTGKHVLVPGDMTYEEWYKQFVQGQPAGDSTTQQQSRGNSIPAEYDGDFSDYGELELTDTEKNAMLELRRLSDENDAEYGCNIFKGKMGVPYSSGKHNEVRVPENILEQGGKFFHSHTNYTPPSWKDLTFLLRDNVDEIGVIAYNKDTYTVSIGDGYKPSIEEFMQVEADIRKQVDESIPYWPNSETWTVEQMNYMGTREEFYRLCMHFGWSMKGGRL